MDWYTASDEYHKRTFDADGDLRVLPEEWQRELAALWRLEADVNNGAYLQFLVNWGRATYEYASQALRKIGALKMAEIVDRCQSLVDQHVDCRGKSREELDELLFNPLIDSEDGELIKDTGSCLPDPVVSAIYALSSEFMSYPDDVGKLGLSYYRPYIEREKRGRTSRPV